DIENESGIENKNDIEHESDIKKNDEISKTLPMLTEKLIDIYTSKPYNISEIDNQETDELSIEIGPRTKSYIDLAIQAATISIMQQMQQFITQQAKTQCEWNAQILETINQKLAHIVQPNSNNNGQPIPSSNYKQLEDSQQRIMNSCNSNGAVQGNYPSTPVINSLLLASGTENQGTELVDSSEIVSYRAMDYLLLANRRQYLPHSRADDQLQSLSQAIVGANTL
ncbi:11211_t:CDS:2, partial [Gigaspora margarita]